MAIAHFLLESSKLHRKMNKKIIRKSLDFHGRTLTLETGRMAQLTSGAIYATYGDTAVLATVARNKTAPDLDYFPLNVSYEEKLYAGGRISSSRFVKREGRPTDNAVLAGRLIDRGIRPLFPKDYFADVQVIATVLSADLENNSDILASVAASAALAISDVPWNGPLATVRVGLVDDEMVINPTTTQLKDSKLDLVITANDKSIGMIEASAKIVSEDVMIKAMNAGFEACQPIIEMIKELAKEVGVAKHEYEPLVIDEVKTSKVKDFIKKEVVPTLNDVETAMDETWFGTQMNVITDKFAKELEVGEVSKKEIYAVLEKEFKYFVREQVLENGKRLDGRKQDEVRPLTVEVGVLPRTHGSALFQRGKTQALSIVTLGSPSLRQTIESMTGEFTKRYMHHYNFPPFSNGESGRLGSPGRREIGHGMLAERALEPVLPSEADFPYTIRVVSEILGSSGSTSQASVCGSTLSLMDAGVPLTAPVAGIAMGLMTNDKKHVVLTDIAYTEDANGDMDFKVAGTKDGITAIQMDIKLTEIPMPILEEAVREAYKARIFILDKMTAVIGEPRKELNQYAPKIESIKIDPEKIGAVIGQGGKTINKIVAETGTEINIDDDGIVSVTGVDSEAIKKAISIIDGLTRELTPGEEFDGEVKRIMDFGAFVEVLPGKEGMVHISEIAPVHVEKVEDYLTVGQKVKVRVVEVDSMGRLNLSMRFGDDAKPEGENSRGDRGGFGGGRRPGGFGGDRRGGPRGGQDRDRSRGPRR